DLDVTTFHIADIGKTLAKRHDAVTPERFGLAAEKSDDGHGGLGTGNGRQERCAPAQQRQKSPSVEPTPHARHRDKVASMEQAAIRDFAAERGPRSSRRRHLIEELRDRRHELRGREGLLQQHAVRHAVRGPLIGRGAGHVDHRNLGIELTGTPADVPAGEFALQVDVGDEGP
ncbi:hypothetical protein KXW36_000816, partial [Aspergillus fumigatus]